MPRPSNARLLTLLLGLSVCMPAVVMGESPAVEFKTAPRQVEISAQGRPLATYVFVDPRTPRPYLTHVTLPGGPQLTRHHPPQGDDPKDHDLLHPGIWFALGDLSGHDNWRLKAKVQGGEFLAPPQSDVQEGRFTVRNRYFDNAGKAELCTEECTYRIIPQPWGVLWLFDSKLTAVQACRFGDNMEEMGWGVRVATPLAVKSQKGGSILDSEGRINEKAIRERLADWCDYRGTINDQPVGVTLFADPANPRGTWWHVRDYGFLTANPFHAHPDRKENQPLTLKPGESVRFRFGVALHRDGATGKYDPVTAYQKFVALLGK